MSGFSVPPNQRSHPRNKVSKDAKVIFPEGRGLVEILITDMSVGGARIQLKSSTDLSGKFNLSIPSEKIFYPSAVRWMKGNLVGLQFVNDPK
jgi:hypothetical protein